MTLDPLRGYAMGVRIFVLTLILVSLGGWAFASNRSRASLDALTSNEPGVALEAYQKLTDDSEQSRRVMLEGLHHPSPRVRAACCRALAATNASDAVDLLVAALADPVPGVQIQAAQALSHMRRWPDSRPLIALLADAKQPVELRAPLALGLGQRRETAAIPALEFIARDPHANAGLRATAVRALGHMEGNAHIFALLNALVHTPNERSRLRSQVVFALGMLRAEGSLNALLDILKDSSLPMCVRSNAGMALARLGDPRALPVLQEQANTWFVPLAVRTTSVVAIYQMGAEVQHDFLLDALISKDSYVRCAGARAVRVAHDYDLLEAVGIAVRTESDCDTRGVMNDTLGRLRNEMEAE